MEFECKCVECGKTFIAGSSTAKYCSDECRKNYDRHSGIFKKCEQCGEEFEVPRSNKGQRFCSVDCQKKWQTTRVGRLNPKYKRIPYKCDWCGKEFDLRPYKIGQFKHFFCSIECKREWYAKVWSQSEEWKEKSRLRATRMLSDGLNNETMTEPQILLNDMLDDLGLVLKNEFSCKYYSIDTAIFYNDEVYFIEVMGTYWHADRRVYPEILYEMQADRIKIDKAKRTYVLENMNKNILYLWEDDIVKDPQMCMELIMHYIHDELDIFDSSYYCYYDTLLVVDNPIMQYKDIDDYTKYINIQTKEKMSMKQPDKWITFNCDHCGKESEQLISRYSKHKKHYCSEECRMAEAAQFLHRERLNVETPLENGDAKV